MLKVVLVLGFVAVLGGIASADVAIDTFDSENFVGSGSSFDYQVTHTQSFWDYSAFQFTAQASGAITRLSVPIYQTERSHNNSYDFTLYSDDNDSLGFAVDGWELFDQVPTHDVFNFPITSVDVTDGYQLTAGTKYWFGIQPDTNADAVWLVGDHPGLSKSAEYRDGTWFSHMNSIQAGFRIDVAAVPEPASYAAFGLGLGAFWLRRRRRASSLINYPQPSE